MGIEKLACGVSIGAGTAGFLLHSNDYPNACGLMGGVFTGRKKNTQKQAVKITAMLLDKLQQAVEGLDVHADRAGLKPLISALKELLELLDQQGDADQCDQLLVKLEGEIQNYAK